MPSSIGFLYNTLMPDLNEAADIQEALRLYHYGAPSGTDPEDYNPANTSTSNLVANSIAGALNNLQTQINTSGTNSINKSIFTAKGQLISSSAASTPELLSTGTNNQILIANSATTSGLQWTSTLTSPTITTPVIDTINISAAGASASLWNSTITTGSIATGGSLTSGGITIAGGTTFAGTIEIANASTSAHTVSISNGAGSANKTINIGTASTGGTTTISIGSASGASSNVTIFGIADGTVTTATKGAGYMGMPQVSTGISRSFAATDAGKHIYVTSTGTTQTIPANTSVAFPIGTTIVVVNGSGVSTSIAITSDTLRLANSASTGTRTLASNGMCTLVKINSTEWIASGNGLT